jgi:hypothetical protein
MKPLYQVIAEHLIARENCIKSGNAEWKARWESAIEGINGMLPSGHGFDAGSKIMLVSDDNEIAIKTSFHHMDEAGFYDGWTEHMVIVRPSLAFGFTITVTGEDRDGICDHIAETFDLVLREEVESEEKAA